MILIVKALAGMLLTVTIYCTYMDTITKLSTAESCSRIGTSDEHLVSDLGSKIDGPKQPKFIFLSLKITKY